MERLSSHDETCADREPREVDEARELCDRPTHALLAVDRDRRCPHLLDPDGIEDRSLYLVVRHRRGEEPDVASSESLRERRRRAARVGPTDHLTPNETRVVSVVVTGLDIGRDRGSPVADYASPFAFSGILKKVTVTMDPDQVLDGNAIGEAEMARQ